MLSAARQRNAKPRKGGDFRHPRDCLYAAKHRPRFQTSLVHFHWHEGTEFDLRFFASLRMTILRDSGLRLAQKLSRFRKCLRYLAGIFASALRVFRTSAAFPADDRRDLLD